jgi:hypothetical protein
MIGLEALAGEITAATIRAAETILSAALRVEEPDGVAIVDMAGHGRLLGLCHGSGHNTARAFGRSGIGVFCAAREIVNEVLNRLPHVGIIQAAPDYAVEVLVSAVAPVAAHEVSHAVVSPRDADTFDAEYVRSIATNYQATPNPLLHHAKWIAACHVVFSRCYSIAPNEFWHARLTLEHELYGLPFDPVAEIVAGIDPNANIRETLADPEIGARLAEITTTNAAVTLAAA